MNDLATFPSSVTVVFPVSGSGAPNTGFYEVEVTLVSLTLTQFNGIVGAPWSKLLHRYEQATYAGGTSPSNVTQLTALAEQLAQDWYLWQLAYLDRYFVGIVDWTPDAMHNLEWNQFGQRITTHVQRGVFNPSEDLLIPSNLNATEPLCIPLCNGSEICLRVPPEWVTQGPCASGSSGDCCPGLEAWCIVGIDDLLQYFTDRSFFGDLTGASTLTTNPVTLNSWSSGVNPWFGIFLFCNIDGFAQLKIVTVNFTFAGNTTATYIGPATLNCNGENTFTLQSCTSSTDPTAWCPMAPETLTVIPGACPGDPVVYFSSNDICESATTLTIHGANFLPGATIAFTPTGTGTANYISANQINVTSLSGLTVGALYAIVTCPGTGSSTSQQVATVEPAPSITPSTTDVNQSTGPFVVNGAGFVPGSTSISFDSGTASEVSVTTTAITVNFTVAPDLGALNATVTTPCGTDTQEVANIVSGGGGGSTPSALGGSSTTAAWPTPLSYMVTLPSGSGKLVVNVYYPTVPGSDTATADGVAMTIGKIESVGSTGFLLQYYIAKTGPGSVTIALAATIGTGDGILSNAYFVPSATALDASARASGTGGTADTGVSSTTTGSGGVVAAFGFTSASIGSLTWNSPFTGDSAIGQHINLGGTDYWLVSGNTTIGSGVTFDAGIAGVTLGDWGGVAVSYK